MTEVSGDDPGIRASGIYILTVDGWFESTRDVQPGGRYPDLGLYASMGNGVRRVSVSAAREILSVSSTAVYEGVRLGIGAIVTGDGVRVRSWVTPGTRDRFALGWALEGEEAAAARLPGATVHDERGSIGGVSLSVRVDDLTEYREEVLRIEGVSEA